jgi:hypothetical protein
VPWLRFLELDLDLESVPLKASLNELPRCSPCEPIEVVLVTGLIVLRSVDDLSVASNDVFAEAVDAGANCDEVSEAAGGDAGGKAPRRSSASARSSCDSDREAVAGESDPELVLAFSFPDSCLEEF